MGGEVGADALLEAQGGLAAQLQLRRGAADGAGVEVGDLEEDRLRRLRDLAVAAAHDARDRNRTLAVADHEHVGVEVALDAVQRGQGLAGAGAAGADLGAADEVVVEGVKGLARLEHDVVGHVDDVVDGAHAGADEALLHPGRGGAELDALDDAGGEAPAEVGRLDGDGDELAGLAVRLGMRAIGLAQGLSGDGGDLAGEAEDAEQVRAVRPGRDVEDDIADGVDEGGAERGVLGEDEDALVVVAEAELLLAEDHAGRVDAADGAQLQLRALAAVAIDEHRALGGEGDLLSGGHVGRSADDRLRPVTDIDGCEDEAVGVGMWVDREHLGDADELGVPLLADDLPALDLRDGVGDTGGELRGREVNVDVVAQPGERQFHGLGLLAVGCWLLGVRLRPEEGGSEKCWMKRWSMRFTEVA